MVLTKMIRLVVLSTILGIGLITVIVCAFLGVSMFYLWFISAATICVLIYVTLMFYQWHRPGFRRMFFISMIVVGTVSIYTYEQRSGDLQTIEEPYIALEQWEPFHPNRPREFREEDVSVSLDSIQIAGSTFLYPLYSSFVEAIVSDEDPLQAHQKLSASSRPLDELEDSNTVVFMPEYLLPADESYETTPIANDALVFFTHQDQEVTELSRDQVQAIYNGDMANWSQVGGTVQSIRNYQRDEEDSQLAFEWFMRGEPSSSLMEDSIGMNQSESSVVTTYENYENAIGYTFFSNYNYASSNHHIQALALDDTEPTQQAISLKNYPISITIYAVTLPNPSEELNQFIEWLQSDQAQTIVEAVGFGTINDEQ